MGYKRTGRPVGRPAKHTAKQYAEALRLLEDGASYREVSYSTGIPRTTLREKYPGMGWTKLEGKQFMGWVGSNDKLLQMFDELYDVKRRVQ